MNAQVDAPSAVAIERRTRLARTLIGLAVFAGSVVSGWAVTAAGALITLSPIGLVVSTVAILTAAVSFRPVSYRTGARMGLAFGTVPTLAVMALLVTVGSFGPGGVQQDARGFGAARSHLIRDARPDLDDLSLPHVQAYGATKVDQRCRVDHDGFLRGQPQAERGWELSNGTPLFSAAEALKQQMLDRGWTESGEAQGVNTHSYLNRKGLRATIHAFEALPSQGEEHAAVFVVVTVVGATPCSQP